MENPKEEHDIGGQQQPSVSKKGRKRLGKRKVTRRPKVRGKYKGKGNEGNAIGLADPDVAECIFSDEETRTDFLEFNIPPIVEEEREPGHLESDIMGISTSSELSMSDTTSITFSESASDSSLISPPGSRPSSSLSSRPPSALSSRPSSALSSRPGSSLDLMVPPLFKESTTSMESAVINPNISLSLDSTRDSEEFVQSPPPSLPPMLHVIEQGLSKMKDLIPEPWKVIADCYGFHIILLSTSTPKAIQREFFKSFSGEESLYVHCVSVQFSDDIIPLFPCSNVRYDETSIDDFCNRCVVVIKHFSRFDVCVGANHDETKHLWNTVPDCFIDRNPYFERRYVETCRSSLCLRIVELGKGKRCIHCSKVMKNLRQRKSVNLSESVHQHTPNAFLTHAQALDKLQQQQTEIRKKDKKIAYLEKKIQGLLETEGVNIDAELNDDFSSILANSNLSSVQKMFLQQQLSCSQKSNAKSYRWHPAMIRLALHLNMVSNSAYEALRDSGAVKLPSSRTLYDYSHAITPKEGINDEIIAVVQKRVSKLDKLHQKLHALLGDEMHVSQNLVYRQSDGHLVGYTMLDEVDKEMDRLEKYINGTEVNASEPALAKSILAFMVKGLASDVKCVVAAYPCTQLTKDMLYVRAWNVIAALEKAGIKVLAFVSDGSSVNRAFINMHTPINKTKSGIVFDTINFCSSDRRPLFFIADVCHLLKTIRNCFYNSGEGEKKPRCLQYNGELILWKHIIRLYLSNKGSNFRKSYKLNAQNVFPNSYSCMKVRYAAQVLSNTVANDLEAQNWPNTKETIKFIRTFNKFFDCLNGAFSKQYIRSKNEDLAPYSTCNDKRFAWLLSVLDYLEDWKRQVQLLPISPTERVKCMLSHQTLEGIEIAIRGFIGATKYFLNPDEGGGNFLMARVFSQDPLEQHFSRQRAGGGGSRNPNVSQFLHKQVSLTVQRDLGVKTRGSNVEGDQAGMDISDEPLMKKRRNK